jgi:hypothetical protein
LQLITSGFLLKGIQSMAHKHVLFRSEAREKMLHGASALADAVRVTLGPKSKSVLIEKSGASQSSAMMGSLSPKNSI